MDTTPIRRDILLVGGGHSHVHVLMRFGMRPVSGVRLTLVSRDIHTPYSGMLPGLLAGHYTHDQAHIDLRPLAAFAGARLYQGSATGIDLDTGTVTVDGRPPVPFDWLSLDTGSTPASAHIEGATEHGLPVKPVSAFLEGLARIEQQVLERDGSMSIAVVGAGAGGAELALSVRHRLDTSLARSGLTGAGLTVAVLTADAEPMTTHAPAVRRRIARAFERGGVTFHPGHRVVSIEPDTVRCASGATLAADATIVVTHAGAPAWLETTGLALDPAGFVRVGATLQSITDHRVFAAGDVASFDPRPLPKAGVYAVRQGPVLADTLRRAAEDRPMRPYRPQHRALALMSTGRRHAIASWGPLAWEGDWVWHYKDWIDRRWMRRYQEPPRMAPAGGAGEAGEDAGMRCGGCGAKVPEAVLRGVLESLPTRRRDDVAGALAAAEDAAILEVPPGQVLVQSVDHFRAFIDDPYLFGRITAVHCLGDLFAMGARPQSAQAAVTLAYASERKLRADLTALLTGALEVLHDAGAVLAGGHTAEGPELAFGLTVNGLATRDALMRKGGLRVGDRLVLTKPLGTGAIFAGDMRGEASGSVVSEALASMGRSNAGAALCLATHEASGCTDVTGFGLAGHLLEMLAASGVRAEIHADRLPALRGARALLERGITSTLHPGNLGFASAMAGADVGGPHAALAFDPQTAGGLLAGVARERAPACLDALLEAGYEGAAIIGEVTGPATAPGPKLHLA